MDKIYMENPYITELFKYIYDAIDTYDMAKVVRAALIVEKNINWVNYHDAKSKAQSTTLRNTGNECYKAGKIRQAVQYYNKALVYAPNNSEEMMLAYGNRSAVFFSIRYFSACINDINTCLTMGCSEDLANKLKKRRNNASPFVLEENVFQMMTSSEFVNTYLRFNCKQNPDVPCASADVAFVSRDGAKRATASGDIRPGTVVAIERAFASYPVDDKAVYITCYYCHRPELRLQPCEGCCRALFCGNECRDLCMKEYHHIECQIVDRIGLVYSKIDGVLMMKTAIKMSLQMKWDEFITASKDIGASRMRTASVKQTFSSEEPLSLLCYDDGIEQFLEGKMFNGSLLCAQIMKYLESVRNYFPKEPKKRVAAIDAMARVMLKLYVTFNNHILINSTAFDYNSKSFRGVVQSQVGWFSMSSKLQHSCEPNLLVVGLNSSIALVTLRTIRRGEELTISYGEHYYDMLFPKTDKLSRAKQIFTQTRHFCECRVCVQNMDSSSVVSIKMTDRQSKLYAKVCDKQKILEYKCFNDMCAALDAFPVNTTQHGLAFRNVREMLNIPQTKYFNNVTYI